MYTVLHMCQSSDQLKMNAITLMSSTHMIDRLTVENVHAAVIVCYSSLHNL